MGNLCDLNEKSLGKRMLIKKLSPEIYHSYSDSFLKDISNTQLKEINFITFYSILFGIDEPDNYDDISKFFIFNNNSNEYNSFFSINDFETFINKIMDLNELKYLLTDKDEMNVLIEKLLFFYFELKKLAFRYSNKNHDNIMKKYYCIAIGYILCGGQFIDKIEFIFQTFQNEEGHFSKNNKKFEEFLLISFLVASYCQLTCKKKNSEESFKNEKEIFFSAFNVINNKKLCNTFVKKFFEEKDFYTYEEFMKKFLNDDLQWILTSNGIRYQLEMNNPVLRSSIKKGNKTFF